jgi:hypothetical protein
MDEFLGARRWEQLAYQGVQAGKNIFKKVAKIPPGELQDCALMVKERDV